MPHEVFAIFGKSAVAVVEVAIIFFYVVVANVQIGQIVAVQIGGGHAQPKAERVAQNTRRGGNVRKMPVVVVSIEPVARVRVKLFFEVSGFLALVVAQVVVEYKQVEVVV